MLDYRIDAVTEFRDALGEVNVKISDDAGVYRGKGVSTDVIEGSILSTLDAVNRMLAGQSERLGGGAASIAQQTYEEDMLSGGHTDK